MAQQFFERLKTAWRKAFVCSDGCNHCDHLHRNVSARGCRCVKADDEAQDRSCSLNIVVQQVVLQSSPLTPSSLLSMFGESRTMHVEVQPVAASGRDQWCKSGPGELQAQAHPSVASSGEVWLWQADEMGAQETGPKMELEVMNEEEVCLRVVEMRSRWSQAPESQILGEALFVPAFSIAMKSELTLPLQREGRICGMVRVLGSRDGWELYLSDPNKEVTIPGPVEPPVLEQASPALASITQEAKVEESTAEDPGPIIYDHFDHKPPTSLQARMPRPAKSPPRQKQPQQQPQQKAQAEQRRLTAPAVQTKEQVSTNSVGAATTSTMPLGPGGMLGSTASMEPRRPSTASNQSSSGGMVAVPPPADASSEPSAGKKLPQGPGGMLG